MSLYRLGTAYPPTPLDQLGLSEPMRSIPLKYPVTFIKGNGASSGHGIPRTIWQMQIISQEELDIFLSILTVGGVLRKSRSGVYITTRSPENHNVFKDYTTILHLPQDLTDKRQISGFYTDLGFEFTHLALYTP